MQTVSGLTCGDVRSALCMIYFFFLDARIAATQWRAVGDTEECVKNVFHQSIRTSRVSRAMSLGAHSAYDGMRL